MDREYDDKTMEFAGKILSELSNNIIEIYTRKERECCTNRIIVADLFARGFFRNFNCEDILVNKNLEIKNVAQKIFKNR